MQKSQGKVSCWKRNTNEKDTHKEGHWTQNETEVLLHLNPVDVCLLASCPYKLKTAKEYALFSLLLLHFSLFSVVFLRRPNKERKRNLYISGLLLNQWWDQAIRIRGSEKKAPYLLYIVSEKKDQSRLTKSKVGREGASGIQLQFSEDQWKGGERYRGGTAQISLQHQSLQVCACIYMLAPTTGKWRCQGKGPAASWCTTHSTKKSKHTKTTRGTT